MATPQFYPSCSCCLALSNSFAPSHSSTQCLPVDQNLGGELLAVVRTNSFHQTVNWRRPSFSLDELLHQCLVVQHSLSPLYFFQVRLELSENESPALPSPWSKYKPPISASIVFAKLPAFALPPLNSSPRPNKSQSPSSSEEASSARVSRQTKEARISVNSPSGSSGNSLYSFSVTTKFRTASPRNSKRSLLGYSKSGFSLQ